MKEEAVEHWKKRRNDTVTERDGTLRREES